MGSGIRMFALTTGGVQDALANIDVPMPGHLIGLDWALEASLATDFFFHAQLSFRPTGSWALNDDRGIISEVRTRLEITTTGSTSTGINKYVSLPDIPVMGGERLYLNAYATASVVATLGVMLYFDFDFDKISTRRR